MGGTLGFPCVLRDSDDFGVLVSLPPAGDRGLNLPPTQDTTNAGAFLPGVFAYNYTDVIGMRSKGFNALRLPVNIATACDKPSLAQLRSFIDAIGGRGIICMFESSTVHTLNDGHGSGRVHDIIEMGEAWARIHEVFGPCEGVLYEIFNEPFGYQSPSKYLREMKKVIALGGLPLERCILDGFGYASDVKSLARLGWPGLLAYHFYPWWLEEGSMTQENFSNKLQADLSGLASRVYITEFGAALNEANEGYEQYTESGTWTGGNVNCLRGLHDGLLALRRDGQPIRGVYHWHGWRNGDSYDIWDKANVNGAAKVQSILEEVDAGAQKNFSQASTVDTYDSCDNSEDKTSGKLVQQPARSARAKWVCHRPDSAVEAMFDGMQERYDAMVALDSDNSIERMESEKMMMRIRSENLSLDFVRLMKARDFERFLKYYGVENESDESKARSLRDLWIEIIWRISTLQKYSDTGGPNGFKIRRLVKLLVVELAAVVNGVTRYLMMASEGQRKDVNQRVTIKRFFDEEESDASCFSRLMLQIFGIEETTTKQRFRICGTSQHEEQRDSKAFPGLPTTYDIHTLSVEIPDTSTKLADIGLPGGHDFKTVRSAVFTSKRNRTWTWVATDRFNEMKHKSTGTVTIPAMSRENSM